MAHSTATAGRDFSAGIALTELVEGATLAGRVGDHPVLISRFDGALFAVDGACTHYGGSLADGHAEGGIVRCALHHACFDLRTGEAVRAPAFTPLGRWQVEIEGDSAFVRRRSTETPVGERRRFDRSIRRILIVGAGAAGFACAERLRALGFDGALTMVGAEPDLPCDRPNLSKDYLAGTAPEEWIALRDDAWYRDQGVELRLGSEIIELDAPAGSAFSRAGEAFPFDRLLLATGSEPVRPPVPGLDGDDVLVLRSLADARALIARAMPGGRAVIVGSGFIGLEAAAALRSRGLEVDIVSLGTVPFEHTLGAQVGSFFQQLHERHGVRFHLGRSARDYRGGRLVLDDHSSLHADFVLLGTGVRPRIALAAAAGLAVGDGILVDEFLETRMPGIYAAGDVAAFPDPWSSERLRIEHWVTAQAQGQVAAANMLGQRARFAAAPFFWTEQYGMALRFVGRTHGADSSRIDGDLAGGDFVVRWYIGDRLSATAAVGRDQAVLEDAVAIEGGRCEGPRLADELTAEPILQREN